MKEADTGLKLRHFVYIVECADRTLYTGWTTRLSERLSAHNAGCGAKYTRSRRPVRLRYYEEFADKSEALRRECAIKKLRRDEKLLLIAGFPADKLASFASQNRTISKRDV